MTDKQIITNIKDLKEYLKYLLETEIKHRENSRGIGVFLAENMQNYYFQCAEIRLLQGKEINAELKAENDELKRQHQADKGLITSIGKMNYQLIQEYDKLKTALTEIKDIAESEIDSKEFMAIQCMLNGSVDNKNKVLKQILQKISEVEDG